MSYPSPPKRLGRVSEQFREPSQPFRPPHTRSDLRDICLQITTKRGERRKGESQLRGISEGNTVCSQSTYRHLECIPRDDSLPAALPPSTKYNGRQFPIYIYKSRARLGGPLSSGKVSTWRFEAWTVARCPCARTYAAGLFVIFIISA